MARRKQWIQIQHQQCRSRSSISAWVKHKTLHGYWTCCSLQFVFFVARVYMCGLHACVYASYICGARMWMHVCACVWRLQVASWCLLQSSPTSFIEEVSLAVVCWSHLAAGSPGGWISTPNIASFKQMWTDVQSSPKFNNRLLKSAVHCFWDTL